MRTEKNFSYLGDYFGFPLRAENAQSLLNDNEIEIKVT